MKSIPNSDQFFHNQTPEKKNSYNINNVRRLKSMLDSSKKPLPYIKTDMQNEIFIINILNYSFVIINFSRLKSAWETWNENDDFNMRVG